MINSEQFRLYVVRESLQLVGLWSAPAEELLMGTAAQESHLGEFIKQLGNGPALGVFQMEPATYNDIFEHFLAYRPELQIQIDPAVSGVPSDMITDMRHACVMARLQYYRRPEPLPKQQDRTARRGTGSCFTTRLKVKAPRRNISITTTVMCAGRRCNGTSRV